MLIEHSKTLPPVTAPPPSLSSLALSSVSASLCSPTVFTLQLFSILYIRSFSKPPMSSPPWPSPSSSPIASLSSSPLSLLSTARSLVSTLVSLAPLTVDSVLFVVDLMKPDIVNLRDIKIVKKLGGTVDDIELVKGLVFDKKVSHASSGLTHMENVKIVVIQF
ncbi:hypothetical protein SO802_028550 [Lithocarpus litseifolius]|uniref:Uncharacterized protein n=1 Tax=Lithocarpus litseifolius TaxID=425828 RepID=A0AAW2BQW1_9ROSI